MILHLIFHVQSLWQFETTCLLNWSLPLCMCSNRHSSSRYSGSLVCGNSLGTIIPSSAMRSKRAAALLVIFAGLDEFSVLVSVSDRLSISTTSINLNHD